MEYKHTLIASLVRRTQNGDNNAFAELYSLTYGKVFNYARHYLHDEYSAQDAVSEIFILALRNINKINDPALFVAWLNQISFHVCFDMNKARNSEYGEVTSEMMEEICDTKSDSNPEERIFSEDERARLKTAIDRLNPTEQRIIMLRFFNNMKIDEIVSVTELSKSTVKRRLTAAIEALRNTMNN